MVTTNSTSPPSSSSSSARKRMTPSESIESGEPSAEGSPARSHKSSNSNNSSNKSPTTTTTPHSPERIRVKVQRRASLTSYVPATHSPTTAAAAALSGISDNNAPKRIQRSDGSSSSMLLHSNAHNNPGEKVRIPVRKVARRASMSSYIPTSSSHSSGGEESAAMAASSQEQLHYLKRTAPHRATSAYMPHDLYRGGMMAMDASAHNNSNHDAKDVSDTASLSAADYYGYGSTEDNHNNGEQVKRRGSLSKAESQRQLTARLAEVQNYEDNNTSNMKMTLQDLKQSFEPKKKNLRPKPGRVQRRSSISSVNSAYTMESMQSKASRGGAAGAALHQDTSSHASMDLDDLEKLESDLRGPPRRPSMVGGGGDEAANDTVPIASVVPETTDLNKKASAKTEAMVESLVWFSFHTPRTILEDLISHEIDLWRQENEGRKRHNNHHKPKATTNKQPKSSKGLLPDMDSEHGAEEEEDQEDPTSDHSDHNNKDNNDGDEDDDGSLSSLSDDGGAGENYDTQFSETMIRIAQRKNNVANPTLPLPKAVERECALLFVDMSGFTKLSTMLDVESLSKVINSYFDMIVSEVLQYGGDILKFAGDAFFAEWKVVESGGVDHGKAAKTPLSELNASLVSMGPNGGDSDIWDSEEDIPALSKCVLNAAKCAISIVEKFSDYHVTTMSNNTTGDSMLNVHCGLGMGHLVGLHVGDYKEDQEEEGVELRREFLLLGEPIDQVARAEEAAKPGQVMVSPEAMQPLAYCCDMLYANQSEPVCIANKHQSYLNFDPVVEATLQNENEISMQPYESLRMHCRSLNETALARLHLQMALYVHPVIRSDELALSAAIQAGKISQPTETVEGRHRAEAELRSVFTIFVNAIMSPKVTGVPEVDMELFRKLADVMHVTSRELDRYSGHLRQFIVDDKGVVLIATFGLRGSTFPNMVSNNGLPAIFAIHRALKSEVGIENRIGATFGKVYCGVVGGIRRHEFAVMGAPVNLAARLMGSKVNNGILVDEAVQAQADSRFEFKSLPPVKAKGYDRPVPILEPSDAAVVTKKKKSTFPFTGRKEEKRVILGAATAILEDPLGAQSSMVFLMGESGMGKTALALAVMDDIKKAPIGKTKTIVTARSTSTETEQRIPLSSYRKIFLSIVRDLCEHEETSEHDDLGKSVASAESRTLSRSHRGRSSSLSFSIQNEGSDRPALNRTKGLSSKELAEEDRFDTGGESGMDTITKSLREISEDLADLSTPANRDSSRDQLPLSLNSMSMHGGAVSKRPPRSRSDAGASPGVLSSGMLSKTTHRPSMGRERSSRTPRLGQSLHMLRGIGAKSTARGSDDASAESGETRSQHGKNLPYFEKLCWVCEQLSYPFEYADIVGSQFLGLEDASAVTHIDGHTPTMDELVEFLALAFICLSDFADMIILFVDDFQWVDSFSWKIFRVLCKRGKKILMLCAMRSHDKQALRRLSTAANRQGEIQNQMIEISMVPLDFSEIQLLMAVVLGYHKKSIPETLCTDVFQRTGGLPVYVVQMLEDMKRKKTVELGDDGTLKWTAAGLKDKRAASANQTGAVMEETFLSRFDGLDVRVRKVLQTCAVLGLSFALSDVIQVHPEMEEVDIENALDTAVDELILIEQIEDDEEVVDDVVSVKSASTGAGSKSESSFTHTQTIDRSRSSDGFRRLADRFFQFSHAMWRKNVLTTMLKERKIELHRLIAESMEKNQVAILEDSDISRLLTLFDHWKSCGDFSKSAPLALTVGARLEEWDLCAQSLELYEDALEMSFDSVNVAQDNEKEWVQVSAKPSVLDLILRLHVHVGLCHKKLGDDQESISTFEDAYKIMRTASKVPSASKGLMIPIISSLCVLQMSQTALDSKARSKQEKLLEKFVTEATNRRSTIHIGRAMSMRAVVYSRYGELDKACATLEKLRDVYSIPRNSKGMINEYGRDYAIEAIADSVQWYYLMEEHDKADEEADMVIEKYLPLVDPQDVDACMSIILPIVQVFRLTNRADDADWLLKQHVINPAHEQASNADFWVPLFNPLAYVIELIMMEESEVFNDDAILEMETWALAHSEEYAEELERKAHTLIGEICWRLANYREEGDEIRDKLEAKAQDLLRPVARYPHGEFFLRKTAQALMDAF